MCWAEDVAGVAAFIVLRMIVLVFDGLVDQSRFLMCLLVVWLTKRHTADAIILVQAAVAKCCYKLGPQGEAADNRKERTHKAQPGR